MTIGEIAKKYNLNTPTLRYYESIGLIGPVKKNSSGIREYSEKDEARVEFICCMRNAGMSIEALQKYIKLYEQGESTAQERKELLYSERKRIEDKIIELQAVKERLDKKILWTESLIDSCK